MTVAEDRGHLAASKVENLSAIDVLFEIFSVGLAKGRTEPLTYKIAPFALRIMIGLCPTPIFISDLFAFFHN